MFTAPRLAAIAGAALLVVGVLSSIPTTASAAVPESTAPLPPASDPFYAVPPGLADVPDGTILNSRPVSLSVLNLIVAGFTSYQVLYRTTDNNDQPTATVETVFVPTLPWLGSGPRPLVSYQEPEDGISSNCAPSYELETDSGSVPTEITAGLDAGWTVVVPDYEGPDSQFLGATIEAHEVLDGVRAALAFAPADVAPGAPIGLWGYSGGGTATALAAQAQSTYAPELHLTAVAMGGVLAEIEPSLVEASELLVLSAEIPYGIAAVENAYPDEDISQYLNAAGNSAVAADAGKCLTEAELDTPIGQLSGYEAYPGSLTSGGFTDFLHSISAAGVGGVPTEPVYDYHAITDEAVPISGDRELMHEYCNAGDTVDHVEMLGEHFTVEELGIPGAVSFLSSTFAGVPAVSDCSIIPAP